MNLSEFVTETLTQISKGVADAQKEMEGRAEVGGRLRALPDGANNQLANLADNSVAHLVTFDVALTVTDTQAAKAKLGVVSGIFNAGGSASTDTSNSEVSRVRFSVPVKFDQAAAPKLKDWV